jgi:hypothetical protein
MKNAIVICLAAAALSAGAEDQTAREILALERQAMDGWRKGDPDPSLAIAGPDITCFHAVAGWRVIHSHFSQARSQP